MVLLSLVHLDVLLAQMFCYVDHKLIVQVENRIGTINVLEPTSSKLTSLQLSVVWHVLRLLDHLLH